MALLREKNYERNLNKNPLTTDEILKRVERVPEKISYMFNHGFKPHNYQLIGLTSEKRNVVYGAGRRGGKSVGAAWDAAYLANPETGPEELKRRGVKVIEGKTIFGMIMMPDKTNYKATPRLFIEALSAMIGEEKSGAFQYNRNENRVYIPDKYNPLSIIDFQSADNPAKLRGEGYSWTWWDEPGFINGAEAWHAFSPALTDHIGCGIFSTTPGTDEDHWWFYDMFVDHEKLEDDIEYIEWYSIENPHYPRKEWERVKRSVHPLVFRREYMAKWEKGTGKILKVEWLSKNAFDFIPYDKETNNGLHYNGSEIDKSKYFVTVGVDLAISEKKTADYTVIAVLAINKETGVAYLVDMVRGHLDFPSQIDAINEINLKWNPEIIGVESVGYQRALVQQINRNVGMAPVIPMDAPGRKAQRILTMSPAFRAGSIRVPRTENIKNNPELLDAMLAFWQEWSEFSMDDTHKHDDTLDAVEIAIRTSPMLPGVDLNVNILHNDIKREYNQDIPYALRSVLDKDFNNVKPKGYDKEMGIDW